MEPEKLALPRPELWCWDMMDWLARKGFKAITFELGAPLGIGAHRGAGETL